MGGLVHLYYGDGKGKTTAAMGLAVRAAAHGLRIGILQFLKKDKLQGRKLLETLPNIEIIDCKAPVKFSWQLSHNEKMQIRAENDAALGRARTCRCDLLVLDEAINAHHLGLFSKGTLEDFVENKPEELELVLTGRTPSPFFVEHADYVTEMVCRKHPYEQQGIPARKGIEF